MFQLKNVNTGSSFLLFCCVCLMFNYNMIYVINYRHTLFYYKMKKTHFINYKSNIEQFVFMKNYIM